MYLARFLHSDGELHHLRFLEQKPCFDQALILLHLAVLMRHEVIKVNRFESAK